MIDTTSAKVPASFWIISGFSLLWNAFGGYDYTMTRLRNVDYLSQAGDPQVMLAWIDSFPIWVQVLWPVGVWGSLIGSVLLLLRSRHAVTAFLVSLVGAIGSFAYQFSVTPPAALDTSASKVIPLVIIAVVIFLWWYARRSAEREILR
jgi:hypothetical protein